MSARDTIVELATEEIQDLKQEVRALKDKLHDEETLSRFWRLAAEHAVTGWNALEEKHELLLDTLRALSHSDAPPDAVADTLETVDVGFGPMRVLETETPIEEK